MSAARFICSAAQPANRKRDGHQDGRLLTTWTRCRVRSGSAPRRTRTKHPRAGFVVNYSRQPLQSIFRRIQMKLALLANDADGFVKPMAAGLARILERAGAHAQIYWDGLAQL